MSSSIRHLRRLSTAATATTTTNAAANTAKPLTISKAKSQLRHEHDPDKALRIYTSLPSSSTSSRYAQEITVKRLAKSRRFDDIENLIESHKADTQMVKEEPYVAMLIRSYGTAGMFGHALRTYEEMEKFGTPRSVVSFNALLWAGNKAGEYAKVRELFEELPGRYQGMMNPDGVSYGMLVKACCELGLVDEGVRVLREIEGKMGGVGGIGAVSFTTVLGGLYKSGRSEEAEELWGEMVRKGLEVDVTAYNVRIMNRQGGKPEDVSGLIDGMIGLGLKPDTISFNYLMTCYFKNGMVEEAKQVYEGLEGNGCKPNAATFRTMVFHLCRNEEYIEAHKIFKESVGMDKIPDFNTLKHLVDGLVKKEKIKEAKGMIRTIKKKFPPSFLNAWKKVENNLGLASTDNASSDSGTADKGAAA